MRVLVICVLAACAAAPRAITANDARSAAVLFAPDAELSLVAGPSVHGREAIAKALDALSTRFENGRIALGRQWSHDTTRVVEFVLAGRQLGHPIGVAGAAVITLDGDGLIAVARIYLDIPTVIGQLAAETTTRAPITSLPAGTTTATGSPTEAANLATTETIWSRLDAHDPDGVLASAATGYSYDDYSGPAPLDRDGTHQLLERFLAFVQDFKIVAKPTYFAAGPFVITESVEHMTFKGASVTLHGLDIKQFDTGRVVREWQYANGAEVLAALLGRAVDLP